MAAPTVFPQEVNLKSIENPYSSMWHWAYLAPVAFVFARLASAASPSPLWYLVAVVVLGSAIGIHYLIALIAKIRHNGAVESQRKNLQESAVERTRIVSRMLEEGEIKIARIQRTIQELEASVAMAERESLNRAYGPFWDAITEAMERIMILISGLWCFAGDAEKYEGWLQGFDHSFPLWFDVFPRPELQESLFTRLKLALRNGQTDFEFAKIFEHRRVEKLTYSYYYGETLGSSLMRIDQLEKELVGRIDRCWTLSKD